MTSDLERLCKAAEKAHDDFKNGGYAVEPGEYTIEATPEAIVRAVLTELRSPSRVAILAAEGADNMERQPRDISEALPRLIDHILGEPATA